MALETLPLFPETALVDERGHLVLGGVNALDLAAEYGTPLYVFDEATLRGQCRAFSTEFRSRYPEVKVLYAGKAFLNRPLAGILAEEGLGLDVVSGGELAVALAGGMPPERIYFHGNNKGAQELREALDAGIGRVVVDNFHELDLLDRLAGEAGRRQDVLVRASPDVDPHTHKHTTTGTLDSKFGFAIATGDAEEAVRLAQRAENLNLVGVHTHLGSPIYEIEPYSEGIGVAMEFAAAMRDRHGLELQEFSPGGGFPIQYTIDKPISPIASYAEVIAGVLTRTCERYGFELPTLFVEPGRAIVGRAGVALYEVGAAKAIPGVRTYVSVDGGMSDNIRPAMYGAAYEAVVAGKAAAPNTTRVTIAGKYCESGDVLIRDIDLPELEAGDVIAIPASGAYCIPMASNYNAAPKPAVVMVNGGEARLLRERETYADLMRNDVD